MKLFCLRVIHFGIYVKYFTCLLKQRAIRIIESKMAAPTVEQIIAQPLPVRVYVYKTHVYHSLAPHPSPPPRFCHTRLQNSFLLVTLARIQLFFLGQNESGIKSTDTPKPFILRSGPPWCIQPTRFTAARPHPGYITVHSALRVCACVMRMISFGFLFL